MSIRAILIRSLIFFSFVTLVILSSCRKDGFVTDENAKLQFSLDTLTFDTVFTERGSATRLFKVFNNFDKRLIINRIYLKEGAQSVFNMNVDGIAGDDFSNIEIGANDSIYIFMEVTVNPDQPVTASPFIIEEKLVFEVFDHRQEILLEAWGQNANYVPNRTHSSKTSVLSCNLSTITWNDPKPYVLFGQLIVDSCTLVLPAGTILYIHGGIARTKDTDGNTILYNDGSILFGPHGNLISQGTSDMPVVIRGDRLEHAFDEASGQWNGIIFSKGSTGNKITYTDIKNAIFGMFVDSASTMDISNSRIFHTSSYGILSYHPEMLRMSNSAIYDNGSQSLLALYGGNFDISYCTFGNFGNDKEAINLFDFYCSDFPNCSGQNGEEVYGNPVNAKFTNCIITGSNKDEFWISHADMSEMNLSLDHCLLRLDEIFDPKNHPDFLSQYTVDCMVRQKTDSLFASIDEYDYHLDSLSIVEGLAIPIPNITIDLEGNMRDATRPDLGCYEYQY